MRETTYYQRKRNIYIILKAVARVPVPATITLKFSVLVVLKIRNSKVYR